MCKTIYRLRVLIQDSCQFHPIHLVALKEKEPTFDDLQRKIQRITEKQNISDYHIATDDHSLIINDNASLRHALKSDNQQRLEIVFYRKDDQPKNTSMTVVQNSDDLHSRRHSSFEPMSSSRSKMFSSSNEAVPVIKPTVLRWTPAILSSSNNSSTNCFKLSHVRRFSSHTTDDMNSDRKDSAISLENVDDEQEQQPHRKKQRVMSADHPRKLPDPSTSPLPSLRNSINLDHNNSMSHGLHPLEIRRPSTAPLPSSPPASPFPRIHSASATTAAPTLPAISSITSPIMHQPIHPQLAPIHNHHLHLQQQQQQQQQFNINNKRTRASVASTHHAHNMQQNTVHLCEHVTGPGKVCGQTFRRSYDLSRHQTIHLENRPFCYCDKCGKKFTRMDALRRHERVQGHSSKHRSMSTSLLPSSQKATSV
ncbi:hypothetical protein V8B55DRAFT_1577746 [Mucor lusitanicus]|uniref:C2H2-type domain-containing protein n=1 Tax=Mucor circinelloides f. lusitanicus TaxID=29924 RepID=A0A8H4BAY9_MUCCL|nr:hypothetical protein FB192DRAFT_1331824 [Mucor lusitanicus]